MAFSRLIIQIIVRNRSSCSVHIPLSPLEFKLRPIIYEFIQYLLMSNKILVELLISTLKLPSLLNLIVNRNILMLLIRQVQAHRITKARNLSIF